MSGTTGTRLGRTSELGPLLRLAEVQIVSQLPRVSVADLDSPTPPIPGCQPAAIRAEGGETKRGTLDDNFSPGALRVKEEDLAALRAMGDGSTIGT